ncbi:hypothetical protein TNCV_4400041 [Trichonephila clavipes]|nr:hypothetical protein TNCV_4400041 [Trichonephila clavipes]
MVDVRNLGDWIFCSSGIGSDLCKIGCVPFLFSAFLPKNPRAGLFALPSIISLIGPEAGAVLHHLKFIGLVNFLTHPTKRNFTTSGHQKLAYKFQAISGADSKTGTNLASHQNLTTQTEFCV